MKTTVLRGESPDLDEACSAVGGLILWPLALLFVALIGYLVLGRFE